MTEFNALLKADANKIFIKKTKLYEGLFYLFDAGMLASIIVNSYAYSKGWDNMTHLTVLLLLVYALRLLFGQLFFQVGIDSLQSTVITQTLPT